MKTKNAGKASTSRFIARVNQRGTHVVGKAPKNSWVSIRNLGASRGTVSGQDLVEANAFTEDGRFRIPIPGACENDPVEITCREHGKPARRKLATVGVGTDLRFGRNRQIERHTFRLEATADHDLRIVSTRASNTFGLGKSKAWFRNKRTGKVSSCLLLDDGTLPETFRLRGRTCDTFQVQLTAGRQLKPPRFSNHQILTAPVRNSEDFDHASMKPLKGPLFIKGPTARDPMQSELPNCWFVASCSAIAHARPEVIENLIKPLEDGRFQVNFHKYDSESGSYVPNPVVVSTNMFSELGLLRFGASRQRDWRGRSETWFPILEKAFAQLSGSYGATGSGMGYQAFEQLLGAPAIVLNNSATDAGVLFDQMRLARNGRCPIYAGSRGQPKPNSVRSKLAALLVSRNHAYTVLDVYERRGQRYVKLRNPWGGWAPKLGILRGEFSLRFDTFIDLFDRTEIGRLPQAPDEIP